MNWQRRERARETFTPPVIIASFSTADKIALIRVGVLRASVAERPSAHDHLDIGKAARILAIDPAKAKIAHVVAEGRFSRDIVVRQDRAGEQAAGAAEDLLVKLIGQRLAKILAKCAIHTLEPRAIFALVEKTAPASREGVNTSAVNSPSVVGLCSMLGRQANIRAGRENRINRFADRDSRHVHAEGKRRNFAGIPPG